MIFIVVAVALFGLVLLRVLPERGHHRAVDGAPLSFGPANWLTLIRLGLFSALGGYGAFALTGGEASGWFPAIAYGAAVLADALDGVLARRSGAATEFGALFDLETDALGMAAASVAAVLVAGTLAPWYLLAGFARYLFALGLAIESALGRRTRPLDPNPFRRRLAGFQMGLLVACLIPEVPPRWIAPAALALGVPFLVGFARDYLVVTERIIAPANTRWLRFRKPAAFTAAVLLLAGGIAGFLSGPVALSALLFAWLVHPSLRT